MNAIEISALTKKFGGLAAVDGVSFSVSEGEIFGLLGPNGAGKTTLISMLVTMKRPSDGKAEVNGFDVVQNADSVRKSIGIVFQDPSLDEDLTAFENLELHAAMYGLGKDDRSRRIRETAGMVELEDRLKDEVKTFSGGMRRRLEIARGLMHFPKVLFLDEPTVGLDPQTRKRIWEYVKRLKKENNVTIVLTTHYLDEADGVCDRVAIMDKGRIIALDSPERLKSALGGDSVSIETPECAKVKAALEAYPWVKSVTCHDGRVDISVEEADKKVPQILRECEKSGVEVNSISVRKPTLDDVFLHFTGRTIREEEGSAKDSMRILRKAWHKSTRK
ncbi:MAG: ATP-binding cassette domain-containing protein [Candidatus Diapherotrites archaeon]|nr:ATP-binding cassette domain-containing protein [Candidatus Diapherotrites archaeon]